MQQRPATHAGSATPLPTLFYMHTRPPPVSHGSPSTPRPRPPCRCRCAATCSSTWHASRWALHTRADAKRAIEQSESAWNARRNLPQHWACLSARTSTLTSTRAGWSPLLAWPALRQTQSRRRRCTGVERAGSRLRQQAVFQTASITCARAMPAVSGSFRHNHLKLTPSEGIRPALLSRAQLPN